MAYLDDFVAGEREEGNITGIAGHEVTVEDTEDGLMRND